MEKFLRRLFWVVATLAVIVGVARALFLNAWTIPDDPRFGASIAPSLAAGDTVLLLTRGTPGFGDLVRCADPDDATKFVIGRIAGVAGDEVKTQGRELFVNGKRYDSEMVCAQTEFTVIHPTSGSPVQIVCDQVDMGGRLHLRGHSAKAGAFTPTRTSVGVGMVFLLSDDRTYHDDSRDFGTVPLASCKETIFFRLWGHEGFKDEKRRLVYVR